MARYEHLPLYNGAMEAAVALDNAVRRFSRYHKYAIGAELRDASRRILVLIVRANSMRDKQAALRELVQECEMLKILLVLAKEIKALEKFKTLKHLSAIAVGLSRQSEGWLQSCMKGRNHQPTVADR